MPNFVYSTIIVRGNESDVIEFFNKGLAEPISSLDELEKLNDYDNPKLSLDSYVPMPATFNEYDTTNSKKERDDVDIKTQKPLFNSDEDYEKYSKGYDDAVVYQRENYGVVGWYDFRCKYWGTKWDSPIIFDEWQEVNGKVIVVLSIESAWDAPMAWLETINKEFENIEFDIVVKDENIFQGN